MRIYGDVFSGNCYKILLAARHLELPFEWRSVDIIKGETRRADFLARNPNGKVPLLELDDGRCLAESNAILNYLADGSALLPDERWQRAQVLQWQFFEQYEHEPTIAVARFIRLYLGLPDERRDEYDKLRHKGLKALDTMERHLKTRAWFVGDRFSIADISLYAYTHRAEEGGFALADFPSIGAWMSRIEQLTGYITMEQAAEAFGQTTLPGQLGAQ